MEAWKSKQVSCFQQSSTYPMGISLVPSSQWSPGHLMGRQFLSWSTDMQMGETRAYTHMHTVAWLPSARGLASQPSCSSFKVINFWLCWVSLHGCTLAFSSCSQWGYSLQWSTGFSLQWLLLFQSTGSRHTGFSNCAAWA